MNPANPTAPWPSFNCGTQQKHFPKLPGWFAVPPFPQDALKSTQFRGYAGPAGLRCSQYLCSLHQAR